VVLTNKDGMEFYFCKILIRIAFQIEKRLWKQMNQSINKLRISTGSCRNLHHFL
jgi:hypothetical protein